MESDVEIGLMSFEDFKSERATFVLASMTVADKAKQRIQELEATITPRRLRDALANDAGKTWVADVEALIATERGKL